MENEVQHSVLGSLAAARRMIDDLIAAEGGDWEKRKKLIDLSGHIAYVSGYLVSMKRANAEYLERLYPSPAAENDDGNSGDNRKKYCQLLGRLFAANNANDQASFDALLPSCYSFGDKMGRLFDHDFDAIFTKPKILQQWCAIQHILWPCRGHKVDKVSLG